MCEHYEKQCPICGENLSFSKSYDFYTCECESCGITVNSIISFKSAFRDFKTNFPREDSFYLAKIAVELRRLNNFLAHTQED